MQYRLAHEGRNMSEKTSTGLRQWTTDSAVEPAVRIGVVLAEDQMQSIELHPDEKTTVMVRLDGDALAVSTNGGEAQRMPSWSHEPASRQTPTRGQGAFVKNIVAGRGFHWQKRVDQTLAGKLEVLPSPDGLILVNELPLEWYLAGVITSEMSSKCPIEFLRAQCTTARSWLLAFTEPKHRGQPFDRCNDDCCQRYQGTGDLSDVAVNAVESTRGLCLVAEGKVVDANYSKSCGGIVELPEHVWSARKPGLGPMVDAPAESVAWKFMPISDANLNEYLSGDWLKETDIYCSDKVVPEEQLKQFLGRVDEAGSYFRWTVRYTHDELLEMLKSKNLPQAGEIARLTDLRVLRRGISGRAMQIAIAYVDRAGAAQEVIVRDQYRIRQLLHKSFLFSSAFAPTVERDASGTMKSLTLRGAGWGHGTGLCQIGALGMSLRGLKHDQIVLHYFPTAELKKIYA
jgi:stage II sporulation protein D